MITRGYVMVKRLLIVIFMLVFLVPEAGAFWVWTPETGRWVNPKHATKETAEEQFAWAFEFYEAGNYTKAIQEWKRLIKRFPLSELTSEAQYHIGLALQAKKDYYEAFLAYQAVLDNYPQTGRIKDIVGKEYEIANLLMFSAKNRAVEIYVKIVENAPYGEYADLALYKIGAYYQESGRYQEALAEFKKIEDDHPNSQLLDDARFARAVCLSKVSLDADYDQELTDEAIKEFEDFIIDYPLSNMMKEAQKILAQLNERKAEQAFKIARFYERQGSIDSAVIYYREVRDKYGDTPWGPKAAERIMAVKKKSGGYVEKKFIK